MSGVSTSTNAIEQWWPAVVAVAAWPAGIVVIVVAVLLLAPRDRQAAVLTGIAELVRAVRSSPAAVTAPAMPGSQRSEEDHCAIELPHEPHPEAITPSTAERGW